MGGYIFSVKMENFGLGEFLLNFILLAKLRLENSIKTEATLIKPNTHQ